MSVKGRIMIERVIAQRIIAKALAEGLGVSIHNGEDEDEPPVLHNPDEALAQIMQTDMDGLYFYRRDEGRPYAWIRLVYGNDGFDVISDYTTNLAIWLEPINKWVADMEADPTKLLELPRETESKAIAMLKKVLEIGDPEVKHLVREFLKEIGELP